MKQNIYNYRYDIRCDSCGKFFKYQELLTGGGGSSSFVPDTEFGPEENNFRCKKCTEKHGCSIPRQSGVNLSVCCIVH